MWSMDAGKPKTFLKVDLGVLVGYLKLTQIPHIKLNPRLGFGWIWGRFGRIFLGGNVCVFVDFSGSEAIWTYKTPGLAHCVLDGIAC